jgi:ribonuclease HII
MVTIKRDSKFKKNSYELEAWANGEFICGIDEVGRGCLAGPVVTAAVILKTHKISRLIKDSKIMTAEDRDHAFEWIIKNAFYGIGITHHRTVDRINIYQATLVSMRRAVMQLFVASHLRPAAILVDAMPLKIETLATDIIAFPFGESKSISIAAASIVAKVTRDRIMQTMEASVPGYALGKHKGYSTSLHMEKIKELNPGIVHRKSFIDKHDELGGQLSIMNAGEHNEAVW